MVKREDGKETRKKLLKAAAQEFSAHGYKNTTIAGICHRAGANVAAVNYYFGDKETLYKEAWLSVLDQFKDRLIPFDLNTDTPKKQLRDHIKNMISNFTVQENTGLFHRFYLMEMAYPTGILRESWKETILPRRQNLLAILRAIVGNHVDELSIYFCEMSIISQCKILVTSDIKDLELMLGVTLNQKNLDRMAEHIAEFSLAGLTSLSETSKKK